MKKRKMIKLYAAFAVVALTAFAVTSYADSKSRSEVAQALGMPFNEPAAKYKFDSIGAYEFPDVDETTEDAYQIFTVWSSAFGECKVRIGYRHGWDDKDDTMKATLITSKDIYMTNNSVLDLKHYIIQTTISGGWVYVNVSGMIGLDKGAYNSTLNLFDNMYYNFDATYKFK